MKVVIAGGGTGGHLFPGLALAEELIRRDPGAEISFVGTEHGIEARIIPREGYPIRFLRSEGIVGKSALKKIKGLAKLVLSFADSFRILREVSPDLVIGVGGYASGAFVMASFIRSFPTLIHEQNSVPGLTNKILGMFADRVCVTYHESLSSFPPSKTFLTGNPIRMRVLKGERESALRLFSLEKGLFTVFVFGGSSGARTINRVMVDALNHLPDLKENIQFLHQTGEKDYENIRDAYRKAGVKGTVAPFIYQMAEAYAAADIVVSRAGATTLAEITALGKPAVLIPFPFAAAHHQEFNALKLKEMGAAMMISESRLSGETLAGAIRQLYQNARQRSDMTTASRGLGRPDACSKVIDIAMSLIRDKRRKYERTKQADVRKV